jgi:hypothetical protein
MVGIDIVTSVDVGWSKGHGSAIGASYHILLEFMLRLDNQRSGEALRWL